MRKGPANSPTVAGPAASRLRIDRRVGSERAESVALKLSTTVWLCIPPAKSTSFFQQNYDNYENPQGLSLGDGALKTESAALLRRFSVSFLS
jgi:hypothetical protein